jgi:hypothetical protein
MHANLGYQPKVSTKFQPNRTVDGWEIPIFVRLNNNKLQTDNRHESQEASKTIVCCDLSVAAGKNHVENK